MSNAKVSVDLQLPVEQIEYIRAVAKLAGVSDNSAASVLLAIQTLRWPAAQQPTQPAQAVDVLTVLDSIIADLDYSDPHGRSEKVKEARAELTRLTEIAESVDPLVVRLGEVTTRLEAANALLRKLYDVGYYRMEIDAHFSEPRT